MSKHQNPRQKPRKKKLVKRLDLETSARRMYLEEGGADLDDDIETQQLTMAAYRSQLKAYRKLHQQGIKWDGEGLPPEAWGPEISPKEARQTGELVRKLLKEKEAWLERCRQKVQEISEEQPSEGEAKTAETPEYESSQGAKGEAPASQADDPPQRQSA